MPLRDVGRGAGRSAAGISTGSRRSGLAARSPRLVVREVVGHELPDVPSGTGAAAGRGASEGEEGRSHVPSTISLYPSSSASCDGVQRSPSRPGRLLPRRHREPGRSGPVRRRHRGERASARSACTRTRPCPGAAAAYGRRRGGRGAPRRRRHGYTLKSSAATPATCGAANEVPEPPPYQRPGIVALDPGSGRRDLHVEAAVVGVAGQAGSARSGSRR